MILSWNCRGMGTTLAIRSLKDLIGRANPDIICLSETKVGEKRMEKIRKQLKWENMIVVNAEGRSGGLAILWKAGVDIQILHSTKNHITSKFTEPQNPMSTTINYWYFTFVYGHPIAWKRKLVWDELRAFSNVIDGAWLLLGDFNAILRADEKMGGNGTLHNSLVEFNDLVNDLGLVDLGFVGPKFTWSNNRNIGENIIERLDRALANTVWLTRFPKANVRNLSSVKSDHLAISLNIDICEEKIKTPFRFHQMWLRDRGCKNVIRHAWEENYTGSPGHIFEKD
ncbi:hypothetical protein ACHQM5_013428 [Ranunculus cassubicifolius]